MQSLRQHGLHGLDRSGPGSCRGGGETPQARLGGLEALDEGSLPRLRLGHGAAEFGALPLEVAHGPLQSRFPPTQGGSGLARQVRGEGSAPVNRRRGRDRGIKSRLWSHHGHGGRV